MHTSDAQAERRLVDLIDVTKDGEWGATASAADRVEVAIIRGTDFDAASRGIVTSLPVRYVALRHVRAKQLRPNDIIIETAGGTKGRPTGRTFFVTEELLDRCARPVLCASFCRFVRVDACHAVPDYVYWWLQWLYVSGQMSAFNTQHTGVSRFQWTVFASSTHLVLPGTRTQQRVARVLSAFDELMQINARRIELLEDLARSLYREWFVRFRFPGWEGERFADTAIGPAPADWAVGHLHEFVTTQYGFTASATEERIGPRFLRGMDINKRSYIEWDGVPYCEISGEQIDKYRLELGDIVVIRMADPGKVGIVERPVDAVFASYLVRLRSKDPRLSPQLLAHYLRDDPYQSWITGSSTGTTRKSASAGVLTEPLIAVPPITLSERFEHDGGGLRAELNALVEQNAALARTRDLVLPRLVTGRLDITDVDLGNLLADENVE